MSITSSSYLALAIFPPPFAARGARDGPAVAERGGEPARGDRGAAFPPALLAFLGAVFLLARGDAEMSADRVTLSLGLILAALVWLAALVVVELLGAPTGAPLASPREGR